MASRAPVATGRLLMGVQKWYYNLSGFNKLGLMREDTLHEDSDVKEAVRRLPEKVYNDRMFRIKRALDLSMKMQILPKTQWTKYEELVDQECHPLQDTLSALESSFSERLIHPRCVKERLRRSFLPAADVNYLSPYLEEVIRERKEREEWMKK